MTVERDPLRDWHRLFGLLLTDFFTDSPFTVEVERDLSEQQQFLGVVILRRGRFRLMASGTSSFGMGLPFLLDRTVDGVRRQFRYGKASAHCCVGMHKLLKRDLPAASLHSV